jgi:hypothetical protein
VILTAVLTGLSLWFYQYTAAPFTYHFAIVLDNFSTALREEGLLAALQSGGALYATHLVINFGLFVSGAVAELLMRIAVIGALLAALPHVFRRRDDQATRHEMRFYAWTLGVGLALVLLIYDVGEWVDFRFFAAPLLLVIGLLIARARTSWLKGFILLWIITLPTLLPFYQNWTNPSYTPTAAEEVNTWAARWQDASIVYAELAPSRWCNSVTISLDFLGKPAMLLGLEPGLGLSFLRFWRFDTDEQPLKARYLLLTDADAAAYPYPELLEARGTIAEGVNLFINNAVGCAP